MPPDASVPDDGGLSDAGTPCLGSPCGTMATSCMTTVGSYKCNCIDGFAAPAMGGSCADIDECATGTDSCDRDPAAPCSNTVGGYACKCPMGFSGNGQGASGCLLTDPSLLSLLPSSGVLSPGFSPSTTSYTLVLPAGTTAASLTPSVHHATHATINVAGASVASGAASPAIKIGLLPQPVGVTITTETGESRTYTVIAQHSPPLYIKASNTEAHDGFGGSVAISADGSTLAVGAPGEDSSATGLHGNQGDNSAQGSGAVYVFFRSGAAWTQQAYVKASNSGTDDTFGASIALSADGSTLAVGAAIEASKATGVDGNQGDNSAQASGAVYVFARSGSVWTQQAYIKASNAEAPDYFGSSVALSADGSTLAVGAPAEASKATGLNGDQGDNSAQSSGAVYMFSRSSDSAWAQQTYVKASNTEAGDHFGRSVALSGDGSTLAVGAPWEASNATGVGADQSNNDASYAGAAYVFSRTASLWTQQAYVKASNTESQDYFGQSVALSANGSTLVVGAPYEASGVSGSQGDNRALCAGAAYVFSRSGSGWTEQAYVKASNPEAQDFFGISVALSSDGSTLAVGAFREDSNATGVGGNQWDNSALNAGAVYVYSRSGSMWTLQAYVKASNTEAEDYFGQSVALSADGSTLAVGTFDGSNETGVGGSQSDNSAPQAGAVFVY